MDLYFLGEHISSMAKVTRFSKKIKFSLEIKILTVTLADNFKFHESNKQQATSNKQQATSNKQQATSNKLKLCLIFIFTLFCGNSFGQGPNPPGGSYWIENCYQEGEINTLITREFKMWTETNYIEIIPRDHSGNILPLFNAITWSLVDYDTIQQNGYGFFSDLPFATYIEETESWVYSSIEAFLTFNTENGDFSDWFSFSEEVKTVTINLLNWNGILGAYTGNPIEINFEDPEDLINVTIPEECQTLDDFVFFATHNIEGLCEPLVYNMILPNHIPNSSSTNNKKIFPFSGSPFQESNSLEYYEDYCYNECFDPHLPEYPLSLNPNPIPCGCITFDLEITIKPCSHMPSPPCEDKILETTYPFTLCCSCDLRFDDTPND
jgi:hypothetical protein